MEKNLKELLEKGLITFTFRKANGETRTVTGTRMMNSAIDRVSTEDELLGGNLFEDQKV